MDSTGTCTCACGCEHRWLTGVHLEEVRTVGSESVVACGVAEVM